MRYSKIGGPGRIVYANNRASYNRDNGLLQTINSENSYWIWVAICQLSWTWSLATWWHLCGIITALLLIGRWYQRFSTQYLRGRRVFLTKNGNYLDRPRRSAFPILQFGRNGRHGMKTQFSRFVHSVSMQDERD